MKEILLSVQVYYFVESKFIFDNTGHQGSSTTWDSVRQDYITQLLKEIKYQENNVKGWCLLHTLYYTHSHMHTQNAHKL